MRAFPPGRTACALVNRRKRYPIEQPPRLQLHSGRLFVSDRNVKREVSFAFFRPRFSLVFRSAAFFADNWPPILKPWGGFIQIRGIHHGVGQFLHGRWPVSEGGSSLTRSSRPSQAAVWKNLLVSLFTVARQQRYSSAFPARGKRWLRRRRRPPPRSMPLPERKEHRADARR